MQQWLYCKVVPYGRKTPYWYITDYDVKIGDYVMVSLGNSECVGCVVATGLYNKKTAPYPVKQTKHIIGKYNANNEYVFEKTKLDNIAFPIIAQERQNRKIEMKELIIKSPILRCSLERKIQNRKAFFDSLETKPFIPNDNIIDHTDALNKETFMCNAVFRGVDDDIEKAMDQIGSDGEKICISNGIYEFVSKLPEDIKFVLKEYPNLKAVMFLVDYKSGTVETAYSKSGYPFITDISFVGDFDPKSDSPWWCERLPTECKICLTEWHIQTGEPIKINYKFSYKTEWNNIHYVINQDGEKRQIVNSGVVKLTYQNI